MGLLVDAVSDVLNVAAGEVRPAPDFGARADTRFISGMASAGDKIAVLLDIERLLNEDDLGIAEALAAGTSEPHHAEAANPAAL
jgi:purine-binding chemotaxis protein CheW